MSTSLLYHGFGLTDQEYLKTEYRGGTVIFYIQTKEEKLRCGQCGSKRVIKRGSKQRDFRGVPIGLKPVVFRAKVQRLECRDCGAVQQEEIKYADKKKLYPSLQAVCNIIVGLHDHPRHIGHFAHKLGTGKIY